MQNPYEPSPGELPLAGDAPDSDDCLIVEPDGTLPTLTPKHRPRIFTAFALPVISLVTFFFTSMIMILVASVVVNGELDRETLTSTEGMKALSSSRIGFLLMVVVPQIALAAPSLIAALMSPVPFRERLSLVRGNWPLWAWVAAAFATPLVGWISSILVGLLMQESENLKMMSEVFRGHGESGFLIPLALLIGLTPALCEELLFRGYVQTRLCRSIGPMMGILIASALFAAFHMDWVHSIAVFPLGVYLGFIAWRSGSLFPAMLGHFVNNSISVFAVVLGPEEPGQLPSADMVLFLLIVMAAALSGAVLTAVAVWTLPGPQPPSAVGSTVRPAVA